MGRPASEIVVGGSDGDVIDDHAATHLPERGGLDGRIPSSVLL
jgi:hypothetical protein